MATSLKRCDHAGLHHAMISAVGRARSCCWLPVTHYLLQCRGLLTTRRASSSSSGIGHAVSIRLWSRFGYEGGGVWYGGRLKAQMRWIGGVSTVRGGILKQRDGRGAGGCGYGGLRMGTRQLRRLSSTRPPRDNEPQQDVEEKQKKYANTSPSLPS